MELTGPRVDDTAFIRSDVLYIPSPFPFELVLRNSRVGADGIIAICESSAGLLRELDLSDTQIDDDMMVPLSKATELRSLILDGTRITNKAIKVIAALPKLEHLSLRRTGIDVSALKELGTISSLRNVELDGTNIAAAEAEKFQSSLRQRAKSH
jgi:hypothetical protein